MREMVLNHVSLRACDRRTALTWLTSIASGMAILADSGIVRNVLRSSQHRHEIYLFGDLSLQAAIFLLEREAKIFLLRLGAKVPLLVDSEAEVTERFLRCQETNFAQEDGKPLLLCALADSIAVGFPSDDIWQHDQIKVEFEELLGDGITMIKEMEFVDNLVQCEHASAICQRHQEGLREQIGNLMELWKKRERLFPNLRFGLDIESQLMALDNAILSRLINKLAILDKAAKKWPSHAGSQPPWECPVRDESQSVKENPRLAKARIFRSYSGVGKAFELHARLGRDIRIHLCIDANLHEVEIGYIGKHLPTQRFPD